MAAANAATAIALHGDQCPASYLWVMIRPPGQGRDLFAYRFAVGPKAKRVVLLSQAISLLPFVRHDTSLV